VVHVSLWLLSLVDPAPFDRNCHKSIPVYLNPTRDADGIVGPVVDHRFDERHMRDQNRQESPRDIPRRLIKDPRASRSE